MNILKRIIVYKELRKAYSNPSEYTTEGLCKCLYRLGYSIDLDDLTELYSLLPLRYRQGFLLYAFPRGETEERLEVIQNALMEVRTLLFCYFILGGWVASCLVSLGMSL